MCSSDSLRFLLFLLSFFFFFLMIRLPSSSTLFPYTTLFRSTMDVSSYLGQTLEFSVTNDAGRCRLGVIEINGAPAPNLESAWNLDDPRANVGDGKILVYCGNVPSPDEHRPDVHMPCGGSYTGPVAMPVWVDRLEERRVGNACRSYA